MDPLFTGVLNAKDFASEVQLFWVGWKVDATLWSHYLELNTPSETNENLQGGQDSVSSEMIFLLLLLSF